MELQRRTRLHQTNKQTDRKKWSYREEQASIKLTNRQTERDGATENNKA